MSAAILDAASVYATQRLAPLRHLYSPERALLRAVRARRPADVLRAVASWAAHVDRAHAFELCREARMLLAAHDDASGSRRSGHGPLFGEQAPHAAPTLDGAQAPLWPEAGREPQRPATATETASTGR